MNKPEKAKEALRNHLILAGALTFHDNLEAGDGEYLIDAEFIDGMFDVIDDAVAVGAGTESPQELRELLREEARNALANLLELAKEFKSDAV